MISFRKKHDLPNPDTELPYETSGWEYRAWDAMANLILQRPPPDQIDESNAGLEYLSQTGPVAESLSVCTGTKEDWLLGVLDSRSVHRTKGCSIVMMLS